MTTALDILGDNAADLAGWLDATADVVADFDDEQAVMFRAQLEQLLTQVRGAIATVDRRLIELLGPGQTCTAPGHGAVSVNVVSKKSTHGAKLASRLAARVADEGFDRETGVSLPPAELCRRTADELVDVFGLSVASTRFRSSAVKARGLKVGEFVDYGDGTPVVKFEAG